MVPVVQPHGHVPGRVPVAPVDAADTLKPHAFPSGARRVPEVPNSVAVPAVRDTYRQAEKVCGETVATMAAEFGWCDCTGHHRRAAGGVADLGLNPPGAGGDLDVTAVDAASLSDLSPVRVENCRPAPTRGYRRPRSRRHEEEHEA